MTKFNLKKHIAKNQATFFGSLTEGQFSWMTQDTGQQIGSEKENTIPVYMFDNKGRYYYEKNYDGYGDFGGKDYYELLAQMNGYSRGDRMDGIDMAFGKMKTPNGGPVLFPALVTKPNEFDYRTHDFTKEAETDPNQSWYASEEEEDFIDQNDEEVYGSDDEEELDENKENLKESVKILDRQVDLDQAYFNLDVDGTEMSFSYWDYDYLINGDEATYEEVMEMIEKQLINRDKYGFPVDPQLTPEQKEEIAQVVLKDLQTNPGWKSNLKENKEVKLNTKMKKSELKDKIKEMILNEMNLDIDNMEDAPESEVDFLAELEGMLSEESPMNDPRTKQVIQMLMDMDVDGETMEYILRQVGMEDQMANQLVNNPAEYAASLGEAKGDEEVTDDVTADDVTVDDTETIDTETTTEVNPDVKAVQDALTQAQAAAQKLGDGKLTDQIGNTITFFTRAHVVEKGAVAEAVLMEDTMIPIEPGDSDYDIGYKTFFVYEDRMGGFGIENIKKAGMIIANKIKSDNKIKNTDEFFRGFMDSWNESSDSTADKEDMYEAKKPVNEAMFPLLKRILK